VSGRNEYISDLHYALWRLRSCLERAATFSSPLAITIAGWIEGRSRIRPIHIETSNDGAASALKFDQSAHYWPRDGNVRFLAIGVRQNIQEIESCSRRLREAGPRYDWRSRQKILVDIIRELSASHEGIGKDICTVALPHPALDRPQINFHPWQRHGAALKSGSGIRIELNDVFYSPWMISSSILVQPSVRVGGSQVNLNGIGVNIDGPSSGPLLMLASSIRRPPPPRM
jgi:hypothetical protein